MKINMHADMHHINPSLLILKLYIVLHELYNTSKYVYIYRHTTVNKTISQANA